MKKLGILFLIGLLAWACGKTQENSQDDKSGKKEVNIYTHRHYPVDKEIFAEFEKKTGIKVNVVEDKADALMERITKEGEDCTADLLFTVDAGRLVKAKAAGITQPVDNAKLKENIPAAFRDVENHWFGITSRARVIVYSKERVKPEQLSTYQDLASAKWKKKVLARPADNMYNQSLLASLIDHYGAAEAEKWAKGIVANLAEPPAGNDQAKIKDIAAGKGDVAFVNTYYVGRMLSSQDAAEKEAAEKVGVFFPNQKEHGTHINISGMLLLKHSPNKENAILLMEFLTEEYAQKLFAEANHEYPVKPNVKCSELLASWGTFKGDSIPMQKLGELNSEAVKIFDAAGWK